MIRALTLSLLLACGAGEDLSDYEQEQDAHISLLQSGVMVSPASDFFEDIPAETLHQVAHKVDTHTMYQETSHAGRERLDLAPTDSQPAPSIKNAFEPGAAGKNKHKPASLLKLAEAIEKQAESSKAKKDQLVTPTGLKEFEAAKPKVEPDDADDPRLVGFGVQPSSKIGDSNQLDFAAPNKAAKELPGVWQFLSLAKIGAQTAIREAMPHWHSTQLQDESKVQAPVTENDEVDRSDAGGLSAVGLLSRK